MMDRCETFRDCSTIIPLSSLKFHICIPFPVVFMILQMSKIECVNYAHFPKSGYKLFHKIDLLTKIY